MLPQIVFPPRSFQKCTTVGQQARGKGGHWSQLVKAAVQIVGHKQVSSQPSVYIYVPVYIYVSKLCNCAMYCSNKSPSWTLDTVRVPCPVSCPRGEVEWEKRWTLDTVSNSQCDTVLDMLFLPSPSSSSFALLLLLPSLPSLPSSSLWHRGVHLFPIFCWT